MPVTTAVKGHNLFCRGSGHGLGIGILLSVHRVAAVCKQMVRSAVRSPLPVKWDLAEGVPTASGLLFTICCQQCSVAVSLHDASHELTTVGCFARRNRQKDEDPQASCTDLERKQ